jgi:hypothetical protein
MPRPRKNTVHCRKLAADAAARARDGRTPSVLAPEDSSGSESDDDIQVLQHFSYDDELSNNSIQTLLVWKEGAESSKRSAYTGNSRRTYFRRQQEKRQRLESAKNDPKIWEYFPKATVIENPTQPVHCTVLATFEKLSSEIRSTPNAVIEKQNLNVTKWNFVRKLALRHYLHSLLNNEPKMHSSERIASVLFPDRNSVHSGRLIRRWAQCFVESGELSVHSQGKFVKKKWLIHDEDVQRILRSFVRSEPDVSLTSSTLASWVNANLHERLGLDCSLSISSRTGQRWLNILGLRFGKFIEGLYNDGHEQEDVIRYRNDFLERMSTYEKRMIQYEGDFMEREVLPVLEEDSRPLILVTHDESCFGSNDGRSYCWLNDQNKQIRPKGNGRSVMVSAFLCECHGMLRLTDDLHKTHPNVPVDSTIFLKPGANAEGFWKNSDLIAQVKEKAIPVFKLLHPNCDGLFMFDNSQNHHAKAPDALNANGMNLTNGGAKQRLMRDGWYLKSDGSRIAQKMVTDDGRTSKGLRQVLQERGLWDASLSLKEASALLSKQQDFLDQKEWLALTICEAGCSIDYYPKYHCEFNYIEMFWGAAKAWSRANCTFNFNDHVKLVPKALNSVALSKIRKFARKSYRYMDAYRITGSGGNFLTCKQIEYAVKKFRGHRKIPIRIMESENFQ